MGKMGVSINGGYGGVELKKLENTAFMPEMWLLYDEGATRFLESDDPTRRHVCRTENTALESWIEISRCHRLVPSDCQSTHKAAFANFGFVDNVLGGRHDCYLE